VRVKVLEVDEARKRISLTLRLDDEVGAAKPERAPRPDGKDRADRGDRNDRGERKGGARDNRDNRGRKDTRARGDRSGGSSPSNSAMADALRRAGLTGK
jgi:uncharacterized protein